MWAQHSLVGGEVVPNQDSTFLWTDPKPSAIGLWLALEDATVENGCLWSLPGSQDEGVHKRFVRQGTTVSFTGVMPEYDLTTFVPIEVRCSTTNVIDSSGQHWRLA